MLKKNIFIILLLFYNIILFPVIMKSRIWSSYYFNRFDSSSLKTLSVYLCRYFHVRISFASDVSRLLSASRNAVQVSIWDMTVSTRNKDVVSLRPCQRSMYYVEQITSIISFLPRYTRHPEKNVSAYLRRNTTVYLYILREIIQISKNASL